jgi:mono/diheme cytochrome c family protein
MSSYRFSAIGWTLLALALAPSAEAARPRVTPDDLHPGLVTTYRGPANGKTIEIVLPEPTIALALNKGKACHPRLEAEGGTVRWQGYLNVLRPGSYRFSARLRGKLRVTVAGKEVFDGEGKSETPVLQRGPETRLEAGVLPLAAEFTRLPGGARVELFWQAPHFYIEPLPARVLGHLPNRVPAGLHASLLEERGRYLAEEHNCASCHRVEENDRLARGLRGRQGPNLSKAGQRLYPGWIYQWLDAPQKLRPESPMPEMFGHDEAGRVERYAVAHYLASLGGPLRPNARQPNPRDLRRSSGRGRRLFDSLGCVACHQPDGGKEQAAPKWQSLTGARSRYPLRGLGSKTTPEQLAAYLRNPLAIDPSGRMPHMLLKDDEARDLAHYLVGQDEEETIKRALPPAPAKELMVAAFRRVDARAEELQAFQRLPDAAQWNDLGKRLVIDKGCNNCHTIAPGGKNFATVLASATFDEVKSPKTHQAGCLAEEADKQGKAPRFSLEGADRQALRRFLGEGTAGAGSPAPAHAGRVALERFNCLACHSRDGAGGLATELIVKLQKLEKADNAEAVVPPPLTGVGHKLRTPWIREVLLHAGRARPWMGLRMPQFGEANVGHLPEALAALEGAAAEEKVHRVAVTAARIEAGRRLVGKQVFGCINCHDIAGVANTGTRGPDLARMSQRVRYDWYRHWMEEAQRMQPGTRMPTIFTDGKSTFEGMFDGNANAQAEAIWAYLALGPTLPLPEGLEPPKGLVLTVKDRPLLLRTFMPDAGSRAVAVGYPVGVATVFDAKTCRLAYGWTGNFLDASPVWDGRGGNPAKVLGARFWTAPAGCPWAVNNSSEPPDFAAQARDPAYGAGVKEGTLFQGRRRLSFQGYSLDQAGLPTFRYRLDEDAEHTLDVMERPEPLRNAAGVGLARRFALALPRGRKTWLLAGESKYLPRLLDGKGSAIALDLSTGRAEVPASGRVVVLPQGDGKAIVLTLGKAPAGSRWHLLRQGDTWKAMLGLPPARGEGATTQVDLHVWSPYRDDPALLKELLGGK